MTIENKIKSYLVSPDLSLIEKQHIFKLKCRIENTKNNYKSLYGTDLSCVFCMFPDTIESFEHYIETCTYFKTHKIFKTKILHVCYNDIHGDLDAQTRVVKLWLDIQEERNRIVKK